MCGIYGFVNAAPDNLALHGALLRSGTRLLAHRGPDTEGFWGLGVDGATYRDDELKEQPLRIGLGHRRLSILDLSSAGHQPMTCPEGTWLIHNGEIYNFIELRAELQRLGHRFRSESDTEVILAAYSVWGEECVARFNGMWAFALYDPKRARLFLSRDRLGVKPLYYVHKNGTFAFASEVPSLLAMPGVDALIDGGALAKYLVHKQIDDGPATIYRDIQELRGGHNLLWDLATSRIVVRRYWDLPTDLLLDVSDDQALETFSDLIEDAVRIRLRSDVPVSVTLSGGVDSSVVTVAAARASGRGIRAFTSRFPDHPEIDESEFAAMVARACGVEHELVEPDLDGLVADEPRLTRHQGMPYGSLSLYVHWAILRRIRSAGIPVVLSGQGGDENFLGYERFLSLAVLAALPDLRLAVTRLVQGGRHSRLGIKGAFAALVYFSTPWLQQAVHLRRTRRSYRSQLLHDLPPPQIDMGFDVKRVQRSEIQVHTLPRLLRFDDRTSTSLGMETRLPFLDYRIVEFAYRLPLSMKLRDGWTKYLLRRYLTRHVPAAVAFRRNKLGFNAPTGPWTEALIGARGNRLMEHPFARGLLRRPLRFTELQPKLHWDVYNVLHLASLLDWKWADPKMHSV